MNEIHFDLRLLPRAKALLHDVPEPAAKIINAAVLLVVAAAEKPYDIRALSAEVLEKVRGHEFEQGGRKLAVIDALSQPATSPLLLTDLVKLALERGSLIATLVEARNRIDAQLAELAGQPPPVAVRCAGDAPSASPSPEAA